MDKLKYLQALLLKWLKHFNIRSIEQIRATSRSLCISHNIEETHSILKLLYPLLKMGFIEFIGNGKYQVSPSIIISYPQKSIAVGVNLTDPQKNKLEDIVFKEDIYGNIRFSLGHIEIKRLCKRLNCDYKKYETKSPLVNFPKIQDVVVSFEECIPILERGQFYDTYKHKWENGKKSTGIFRVSSDSSIYYLKIEDKYFKIPLNTINPEGRLLAECYQASRERDNFFSYDRLTKTLTVNNLNLPILVERILRLSSLYLEEAKRNSPNLHVCYPDTSLEIVKQLNRIFDTKTQIING